MHYKSISVPVKAIQWERTSVHWAVVKFTNFRFELLEKLGGTAVDVGDWIVEFPNGEVHVVTNERFQQRFQHTEMFTPEEVNNAISMAKLCRELGDCT